MSKRYWEVTMQAELDEETGDITLKCPRDTKRPFRAVECGQDKDMKDLDLKELRSELISAAKEADLKSAAEGDST